MVTFYSYFLWPFVFTAGFFFFSWRYIEKKKLDPNKNKEKAIIFLWLALNKKNKGAKKKIAIVFLVRG